MHDWSSVLEPERFGLFLHPGASSDQLSALEEGQGFTLPADLRDLLSFCNGFVDCAGQWECAWSCDRITAENRRAWTTGVLPRTLLAFGDDGADTCFCVQVGQDASEVVRWSWIGQDVESRHADLVEFWRSWFAAPGGPHDHSSG